MNTLFDSVEVLDTKKEIQKENVSYEHAGYQIRVHFNGEKTLIQCIQNLTERKNCRLIFLSSCCKIKTIKDNDYARPMKRGIECIRQEFIAEFPLKSKIKRVNTAIVFTLRFRWQEIILQRIKILQRKSLCRRWGFWK